MKSDMTIILQRDYYTTILHKTHYKIEDIICLVWHVCDAPLWTPCSGTLHAYFGAS